MTRYHLEYRVPREGERFICGIVRTNGNPAINTMHADAMGGYSPYYVLTEDRPRGEHPEALLIRVNGELYGRTYTTSGTAVAYTSVNDCTNYQFASDITEWEVVYDEVPAPEPEPDPAWPDKPVIAIEKGVCAGETLNKGVIAVREAGTLNYRDGDGSVWISNADTIHEWHEYVPDGYVPLPESPSDDYQAGMRDGFAAAQERREYTADDLDSLPEGACAWDEDGDVWQRGAVSWFVAGGCGTFTNPLREGFRVHFYSTPAAK